MRRVVIVSTVLIVLRGDGCPSQRLDDNYDKRELEGRGCWMDSAAPLQKSSKFEGLCRQLRGLWHAPTDYKRNI